MFSILRAACSLLLLSCLANTWAQEVRQGSLDNGFSYIVRSHATPPGKVELRLLVKTGSLDEADDERGIAHLVEHMAFGATEHFPNGEVQSFLASQGMKFGNDSNAFTSHHATVYTLTVAIDALPRALRLMADWAGGDVVFDPKLLTRERQIVLDELRLRESGTKTWAGYLDQISPDGRYGQRMPIGQESVLRTLPDARIEAFYRKHYVAPRMTLVVVGDIAPKAVEREVKSLFTKVTAGPVPEQAALAVPLQQRAVFNEYHTNWLSESQLEWGWVEQRPERYDEMQYRRDYRRLLAFQLVQNRLDRVAGYSALNATLTPHHRLWSLLLKTPDGGKAEQVEKLYTAIAAARQHGFTAQEIDAARRELRAKLELAVPLEPSQTQSALWAGRYANAAQTGELVLEAQQLRDWLALAEIQSSPELLLKTWQEVSGQAGQLVSAWKAEREGGVRFVGVDADELARVVAKVDAAELAAPQAAAAVRPLLSKLPEPGQIATREPLAGGGVLRLENGATVLWQRARRSGEQMGLALWIDGGQIALPYHDRIAVLALPTYLQHVGYGDLDRPSLLRAIEDKQVWLQPWQNIGAHGLSGAAAAKDIETLFQLVHLSLQPLPLDNQAAERARDRLRMLRDGVDTAGLFERLYDEQQWPLRKWHDAEIRLLYAGEIATAWRNLYGDPGHWVFAVTGVTDEAALEPLVARYIASATLQKPSRELVKIEPLQPKAQQVFGGAVLPQAEAGFEWRIVVPDVYSGDASWLAYDLADLLRERLLKALRFDGGISYSVTAGHGVDSRMGMALHLTSTGPASACRGVTETTMRVLAEFAATGPTEAEAQRALTVSRNWVRDLPGDAAYYAGAVAFQWASQGPQGVAFDPAPIVTRAALAQAAKDWIQPEHIYLSRTGCQDILTDQALRALWSPAQQLVAAQ
ncbi:M16 family metallopeptidase [Chitinolyticbacter albus]|uniref:M16 family metallopeptidase n=1 Tax=Chitinolyticbacter albus TaxID=2961951 RepID=UPI00210CA4D8|nr:insulinase family protein [Chitinolyticbacter albus]